MVFIHGSGDSGLVWAQQLEYVRQFTAFRAEAIDLPGHGMKADTLPLEATVGDYAEAVYGEIREGLGMERPVVVGHSLGGAIALTLALEHGSELGGIILIGTGGRLRVLPAMLDEARLNPEEAKVRLVELAVLPGNRKTLAKQIVQEEANGGSAMLYRDLAACNRFDVLNRLQEIEIPTLILCGAEDQLTPVKYSQYLQQKIVGAELEIVPEAGHYVMREQPEIVNALIKEWLDKAILEQGDKK
jgi:pimeloyl-ACP methyl ester carboxylesterase